MDESWDRELRGTAPSFQEFLTARHLERRRFLDRYMASRGIAAIRPNRDSLEAFLEQAAGALAENPTQAERVLDAFIRVRPERFVRVANPGERHGRIA